MLVSFLAACSQGAGSSSSGPTSAVNVADGTYTENASYQNPVGTANVTFVFTVKNNMLTDVAMTSPPAPGPTGHYQSLFMAGIQEQVVGKSLNDIGSFSRVNGSSLTSGAFNQAIQQLKQSA